MFGWFKKEQKSPPAARSNPPGNGCIASEGLMAGDRFLGVMMRTEPRRPEDSGWSFEGAGEEGLEDPKRWAVYALSTVVERCPEAAPYLDEPIGTVLLRNEKSELIKLKPEVAATFRK